MLRKGKGAGQIYTPKDVYAPDELQLPGKLPVRKQEWWADPKALRQIAEGLVFATAVVLLFVFTSTIYLRGTELARRRVCRSNLHNVHLALEMYTQDHDGRLPPADGDLEPRIFSYVEEPRCFLCPSDDLARPKLRHSEATVRISYSYQLPSVTNPEGVLPYVRTPLLWDYNGGIRTSAHHDGGNVLYLDGHTRWVPILLWTSADRPF